ncbi:TMEM175 family protein [Wenzhouxiangella marina]|uniref:Transglutaminase-like n=1 Tax=Wenzhouxiangella marina TaxID=1579979 RepID=A0A0K0XUI5_9GAMM|nr:TMEM175 family protein [Wenzhouxiangella marina]AKS41325.1 Transglutaminase-like [Wenzhouxiangella marina]MBB6086925.1 putative membrane protein [Wenzhouxiangella marina]
MSRPEFPKRGQQTTRLETFADAAFAFAAAMLAISIDEIPSTYPELMLALQGAPAFAASMAVILMFWYAHKRWSDRFGLDDLPTALLTFLLIMLVMIYVYPLKIFLQGGFSVLTDGALASDFRIESRFQFQVLVTIYSFGFFAMCALIAALHGHAWRCREALDMSAEEIFDTAAESIAWLIVGGFGLVAIALVWLLPESMTQFAPFAYGLLAFFGPIYSKLADRVGRRKGLI